MAAFGDQVTASVAGCGLALIVLGVLGIAGCADIAARLGGEPVGDSTGLDHAFLDDGAAGKLSGNVVDDSCPSSAALGTSVQMDLHSHLLTQSGAEDASILTPAQRAGSIDLDPRLMHPAMQQHQQQQQQLLLLQQQYNQGGMADSNGNVNGQGWSSRQSSSMFDSQNGGGGGDGSGSGYSPAPSSMSASSAAYLAAASSKLTAQRKLYGSICAVITGVFGGSILMPVRKQLHTRCTPPCRPRPAAQFSLSHFRFACCFPSRSSCKWRLSTFAVWHSFQVWVWVRC